MGSKLIKLFNHRHLRVVIDNFITGSFLELVECKVIVIDNTSVYEIFLNQLIIFLFGIKKGVLRY